jgi:hypothetical protein
MSIRPITPHPLLDYTIRHNIAQDRLEEKFNIADYYENKLKTTQENHRIKRNYDFKKDTEDINLYTSLEKSYKELEYKQQYYLGTTVDKYI